MDGVTILNTFIEKLEVAQPWFTIGLVLTFGGLFGFVVFGVIAGHDLSIFYTIMSIICCIGCFIGILIGQFAPRETETRYQVIIDDSVNFNEFQERYEIIEVDGQIYTVRLR